MRINVTTIFAETGTPYVFMGKGLKVLEGMYSAIPVS